MYYKSLKSLSGYSFKKLSYKELDFRGKNDWVSFLKCVRKGSKGGFTKLALLVEIIGALCDPNNKYVVFKINIITIL